jgi:predicted dehydrogenase
LGPAELIFATHRPAHSLGLTTDGLAELMLQHRSGVLSNIHLNFVQRDYRRTIQIIGESGTLYWDFKEERVRLFGEDGLSREEFRPREGWTLNDMYVDELSHFLDCVARGRATANSLAGGVAALEIALAARAQSANEKRRAA